LNRKETRIAVFGEFYGKGGSDAGLRIDIQAPTPETPFYDHGPSEEYIYHGKQEIAKGTYYNNYNISNRFFIRNPEA